MTETQKPPSFPPPSFLGNPYRRLPQPVQLPPLTIPPNAVRPEYQFRSPIAQPLPSIQPGPPARQSQPRLHVASAAPVEKLLQSNPYTPPRSDPPYSPQQYGPSSSPRSQVDDRSAPRRLVEHRYSYEDRRPSHPEQQQYASLASPIEPSQKPSYAPLPSPSYTPNYASSNTPFRGSIGSHRGSIPSSLGSLAYPEPATSGPRPAPSAIPLPGSVPQPVVNEKL
jgi:hypothetical protein